MFPPYSREMRTNTAKFKSAAILPLAFSMEMVQPIPTRALSHARGLSMRTHLTAVDCGRGCRAHAQVTHAL